MRILLIEDDNLVRAVLVDCLLDACFDVIDFSDPHVALGAFDRSEPPDVVITDVDLGSKLDGFAVATAIHHSCPTVPVILISGRPTGQREQNLDPHDRFLQKPFSNDHLLRTIEQLTEARI